MLEVVMVALSVVAVLRVVAVVHPHKQAAHLAETTTLMSSCHSTSH